MVKVILNFTKKIFLYLYFRCNIIVLLPHPTAIGNCSEEICEAIKIASLKNKKILLILPIYLRAKFIPIRTINPKIFAFESKYFLLKPLSIYLIPLRTAIWIVCIPLITIKIYMRVLGLNWIKNDFYPYFGTFLLFNTLRSNLIMNFDFEEAVNEKKLRDRKYNYEIKLSKKIEHVASKFIREVNMSDNDWYICLHVRNSEYYNDSYDSPYRNANILNYIDLINLITEKGGWVFRLGNNSMPRISEKLLINKERVVDLAHSRKNKPEINAWLIANCNCYIGMQSGPYDYARLFKKQIILLNMYTPIFGIDNQKNIIGFYKEFREKKGYHKATSLDVIRNSSFNLADFTPLNYTQRELSSAEILEFAAHLIPCKSEDFLKFKKRQDNKEFNKAIEDLVKRKSESDQFSTADLFRWVQRTIYTDFE